MMFQNNSRQYGKTPTVISVPRTTSTVESFYGVGIFKRGAVTLFQLDILQKRREEASLSSLPSFLRHMLLFMPSYIIPAPSKTRQEFSSQAKKKFINKGLEAAVVVMGKQYGFTTTKNPLNFITVSKSKSANSVSDISQPSINVAMDNSSQTDIHMSITHNSRWQSPISDTMRIYQINFLSHIVFRHSSQKHGLLVVIFRYQVDIKKVVFF